MEPYLHKVHYYETDKMGIVHHSNYIRWMEEARVELLDRLGISFAGMEARGIYSPVVGMECRYHCPTRFDETVAIRVSITEFKGVRLKFGYEMENAAGKVVATGASEHCFTDPSGKLILLKKHDPEIYDVLRSSSERAGL